MTRSSSGPGFGLSIEVAHLEIMIPAAGIKGPSNITPHRRERPTRGASSLPEAPRLHTRRCR
jgi:hypothetical protein